MIQPSHPLVPCRGEAPSSEKGSQGESENPKQTSSSCDCFQKKLLSAGLLSNVNSHHRKTPAHLVPAGHHSLRAALSVFCLPKGRTQKNAPCDKHVQAMGTSQQPTPGQASTLVLAVALLPAAVWSLQGHGHCYSYPPVFKSRELAGHSTVLVLLQPSDRLRAKPPSCPSCPLHLGALEAI